MPVECSHEGATLFTGHDGNVRCGRCGSTFSRDELTKPKRIEPRDYQIEAFDSLRAALKRRWKRIMLCAPTGSGKTIIAIHMAKMAIDKGNRVLFIADRRALVDQATREFGKAGVDVGMIQAGRERNYRAPVQVASAQTLEKWEWEELREFFAGFDLVVVDEAHRKRVLIGKALVEFGKTAIGLSATPITDGLRETWQDVVMVRTTRKLIDDKWLIEPICYVGPEPDLRDEDANSNGEWSSAYVSQKSRPLVGDLVSTWERRCKEHFNGPVPTLVFSSDIQHGKEIREAFAAAGYDFAQTTANDTDDESTIAMQRYLAGEVVGLISVDKCATGVDAPSTQCLILARSLRKSLALHIQMLGRGMRTAPGKSECIVLDHAGNVAGFQDEVEDFWRHGLDKLPEKALRPTRKDKKERGERVCVRCGAVLVVGKDKCIVCGMERPLRVGVRQVPGELERVVQRDPWTDINLLALERFPLAEHDESVARKATRWARANYHSLTKQPTRKRVNVTAKRRPIDPTVRQRVRKAFQAWIIKKRAQEAKT